MEHVSYFIDGESYCYSSLFEISTHLSLMSLRDRMRYDGVLIIRQFPSRLLCTHEIVINGESITFKYLKK